MISSLQRLSAPVGQGAVAILVIVFTQCCPLFETLVDREPIIQTERAIVLTDMAGYDLTRTALQQDVDNTNATLTAMAAAPAPEIEQPAPQIEAPLAVVPPVDAPPAPAPLQNTPAPASSPPVITRVDFLKSMPADGNKYFGWVSFTDADGDVNRIKIETVHATTPTKDFEGDPRPNMQGTPTSGRARIGFFCTVPSTHTLRVTLFDEAGNSSNSMEYSFECY